MKALSLADFSGGISEQLASQSFERTTFSEGFGFMIDGSTAVRSQWALQTVQMEGEVVGLRGFSTDNEDYLVLIREDGTVQYGIADEIGVSLAPYLYTGIGLDTPAELFATLVHQHNEYLWQPYIQVYAKSQPSEPLTVRMSSSLDGVQGSLSEDTGFEHDLEFEINADNWFNGVRVYLATGPGDQLVSSFDTSKSIAEVFADEGRTVRQYDQFAGQSSDFPFFTNLIYTNASGWEEMALWPEQTWNFDVSFTVVDGDDSYFDKDVTVDVSSGVWADKLIGPWEGTASVGPSPTIPPEYHEWTFDDTASSYGVTGVYGSQPNFDWGAGLMSADTAGYFGVRDENDNLLRVVCVDKYTPTLTAPDAVYGGCPIDVIHSPYGQQYPERFIQVREFYQTYGQAFNYLSLDNFAPYAFGWNYNFGTPIYDAKLEAACNGLAIWKYLNGQGFNNGDDYLNPEGEVIGTVSTLPTWIEARCLAIYNEFQNMPTTVASPNDPKYMVNFRVLLDLTTSGKIRGRAMGSVDGVTWLPLSGVDITFEAWDGAVNTAGDLSVVGTTDAEGKYIIADTAANIPASLTAEATFTIKLGNLAENKLGTDSQQWMLMTDTTVVRKTSLNEALGYRKVHLYDLPDVQELTVATDDGFQYLDLTDSDYVGSIDLENFDRLPNATQDVLVDLSAASDTQVPDSYSGMPLGEVLPKYELYTDRPDLVAIEKASTSGLFRVTAGGTEGGTAQIRIRQSADWDQTELALTDQGVAFGMNGKYLAGELDVAGGPWTMATPLPNNGIDFAKSHFYKQVADYPEDDVSDPFWWAATNEDAFLYRSRAEANPTLTTQLRHQDTTYGNRIVLGGTQAVYELYKAGLEDNYQAYQYNGEEGIYLFWTADSVTLPGNMMLSGLPSNRLYIVRYNTTTNKANWATYDTNVTKFSGTTNAFRSRIIINRETAVDELVANVTVKQRLLTDLEGPQDPTLKFVCEIPRQASTYTKNTVEGAANTVTDSNSVRLFPDRGLLLNTSDNEASNAYVVFETSPGVLDIEAMTTRYPEMEAHEFIDNVWVAKEDVMPHANCGTMWGSRLFLGDVRWFDKPIDDNDIVVSENVTTGDRDDTPLSTSNTRKFINAIYASDPTNPYAYEELSLIVPVDADSRIVDMAVVDVGLVVLTSTAAGQAGLILLRGTSEQFRVEKLRELASPRRNTTQHRAVGDFWSAAGLYAFIAEDGGIWTTNGEAVNRIDGPTTINHENATEDDHVVTKGDYLFASHSGRLLCMRKVGDRGAWTELATEHDGEQVRSMTATGHSVYFIQKGKLYRFDDRGQRGSLPTGCDCTFKFSTGTIGMETGDGLGFSTAQVHRTGFTLSSRTGGLVKKLTTTAGPALDDTAFEYSVDFNEPVDVREEVIASAGIGFVNEASATIELKGDVTVESTTFYVTPGAQES